MHVTFVSLGMELLGVEYLSSYLKAHRHRTSLAHNPALFDDRFQLHIAPLARRFNQDDRIVDYILHLNPDLIGFSALTNTFAWCIDIARKVRERKRIPTIFGGVHASAVPEFVMSYDEVDFVCVSEGEAPLLQLVEALEAGREGTGINNIWAKPGGRVTPPPAVNPFIQDLDALPFPDKDLYAPTIPKRYVYRMMTARGCPYRCTFCFNNFFANLPSEGKPKEYLRRRSVASCMEELVSGKERFDYSVIEFHDDIFTMNKDWLADFLPRVKKEIGVGWVCETHSKFMDEEVARLMKENGCVGTKMGIQSLDNLSYKRHELKRGEDERDLIRALDACKKVGLQLDADHIFGLPRESEDAQQHALEFYKQHTPGRIACFWLTYFPGIEITERAHAEGELSDEQLIDIKRGNLLWYHQVQAFTPEGRKRLEANRNYMVAFHMLPVLPSALRKYVSPRAIGAIPLAVPFARFVMAAKMLFTWLFDGNFGAGIYLRLYLHHIVGRGRRLNRIDGSAPPDRSVARPVIQNSV